MISVILVGICINFMTIRDYLNIPNWFLVFMNLFVPICFTTKTDEDISKLQVKNLKLQTLNCFVFYGLSLTALGLLVYFSQLKMNPDIPVNFSKFLIFVSSTFMLGLFACFSALRMSFWDSQSIRKKILFAMTKIIRMISILGIITFSIFLLVTTPLDETYYVILGNKIFKCRTVLPTKESFMNLTFNRFLIIKRENLQHQSNFAPILILDNEEPKPSSPLPFEFKISEGQWRNPILLISKKDRKDVLKIIEDKRNRPAIFQIMKKNHQNQDYIQRLLQTSTKEQWHHTTKPSLLYPGNIDYEYYYGDIDDDMPLDTLQGLSPYPTMRPAFGTKMNPGMSMENQTNFQMGMMPSMSNTSYGGMSGFYAHPEMGR